LKPLELTPPTPLGPRVTVAPTIRTVDLQLTYSPTILNIGTPTFTNSSSYTVTYVREDFLNQAYFYTKPGGVVFNNDRFEALFTERTRVYIAGRYLSLDPSSNWIVHDKTDYIWYEGTNTWTKAAIDDGTIVTSYKDFDSGATYQDFGFVLTTNHAIIMVIQKVPP